MSAWKQSLATVLLALAAAGIGGVVSASWMQRRYEARVRIPAQPMKVRLAEPVDVTADLVNPVTVAVDARVSTDVPVDQHFQIPLDQTIVAEATINHPVPVKTSVHIKQNVPIDTRIHLDSTITLNVMGGNVYVPVDAWIPLKTSIPVDVVVPIDQSVPLSFTVPVSAHVHQTFDVPLRVKVAAQVPVKTTVQVPLLKGLRAHVTMPDQPIEAVVQPTELTVPLDHVRLDRAPK